MSGGALRGRQNVRLGVLIMASVMAVPASAQWTRFPFGYDEQPVSGTYRAAPAPARPAAEKRMRRVRAERGEPETPTRSSLLPAHSSGRVVIVVSTDQQKLTVYDDGAPVASTTVSTGVADHPTPYGVFSVIEKQRFHASNLYSAAPMPFMQRITWSGVALHEGHVTGRPASHGCIRLPAAFAAALFRYTREGARVIIAREDVAPSPWGSVNLFAAKTAPALSLRPPGESVLPDDTSKPYDVEIEGRPRVAPTGPTPGAKPDFGTNAPLQLLVNRKVGKLYVLRAFKPVMTVPIAIDDPSRPLGTHVFMAGSEPAKSWSSLTLDEPVREASLIDEGRRSKRMRDTPSLVQPPSTAYDALSRLHLAPGTAAYIGSLLTPGATLILSDDGARNRETWDGTNFIALTE